MREYHKHFKTLVSSNTINYNKVWQTLADVQLLGSFNTQETGNARYHPDGVTGRSGVLFHGAFNQRQWGNIGDIFG